MLNEQTHDFDEADIPGQRFRGNARLICGERFLKKPDRVMPWVSLCDVIEPYCFKGICSGGRRPMPLDRMLRIYFL